MLREMATTDRSDSTTPETHGSTVFGRARSTDSPGAVTGDLSDIQVFREQFVDERTSRIRANTGPLFVNCDSTDRLAMLSLNHGNGRNPI